MQDKLMECLSLSWTSASKGVEEALNKVGGKIMPHGTSVTDGSGPPVAKNLKSKNDGPSSKSASFENYPGINEIPHKPASKGLKSRTLPTAGSLNLGKADTSPNDKAERFIPAWRRQSSDAISKIRSKRRGESYGYD